MKRGILLTGLVFALATAAWAQPSITLLTFGGYTFPDQFDTEYGYGKVEDGFQWGAGLEFGLAETAAIELFYQGMNADAYYDTNLTSRKTGKVGVNYAMIGGTRYAPFSDKVSGFGSFDLGVGWFNPDTELASEGATKFAWAADWECVFRLLKRLASDYMLNYCLQCSGQAGEFILVQGAQGQELPLDLRSTNSTWVEA